MINTDGYIIIHSPNHPFKNKNNYVYEHRLMMEKKLDRYLTTNEQIHHIDGDKQNNNINNLRLFSSASQHTSNYWKEKS